MMLASTGLGIGWRWPCLRLPDLVAFSGRGGRRPHPALAVAMAGAPADGLAAAFAPTAPSAAAFRRLVLPHLDAAYNLARYLTRDADAADDIVQEAFLRAYRGFGGYRGGDPRIWLLAIVRNCCRAWAGRRRRGLAAASAPLPRTARDSDDADEAAGVDELWDPDQDTPETALLRRDEAEHVRAALEAVPEPYREVLVLRELEDLPYRAIAEIADVPVGTVMSRLARGRRLFALVWRRDRAEGGA